MGVYVRGLDNFSTGKRENIMQWDDNPLFELIVGDIRDTETCNKACENIDFVMHQAGLGSVPRSIKDPATSTAVNVNGSLNIMLAARDCGVKRFVYASSSSVYGDDPRLPKKEGNEGKLLSPYAITKHVNELYGRIFFDLYNFETIGLRYFNVFGKRQDPDSIYAAVIPLFVSLLLKGQQPRIHGDGLQSRDFTYVENVIHANISACLAPSQACGQAYNIASGGRVSLKELYQQHCDLLDRHVSPIYVEDRPGDIKHSHADITKARTLLGYNPQYQFSDGIGKTIDWYKTNI